jgi:hypothetical protein
MTVKYGECAQGLKPFGVAQECGNRGTRNLEFVRTVHRRDMWFPSWRFGTW